MPASNSLNYANWVEIKVVGGGENVSSEKLGSPLNETAVLLG